MFLVKSLQRTAFSMLEHRAQNDRLIEQLEMEKISLDQALGRAEAASLAKSKFLANMSHELRTPLNAIMGFSEMLKEEMLGPIGNEQYRAYAGDIHKSGEHLLKLINEILDLSRIEAGKYELTETAVDFSGVALESLHLLRLDAQAKNLKLITTFKPDMPQIMADEKALRQICLNLLANADAQVYPGKWHGRLRTGLLPSGEAFLTVRDNGPGIAEEELPAVLSTSARAPEALKLPNNGNGTGLGLPIVCGLAELHGGRFDLRSKPGAGTEASLIMPMSRIVPAITGQGGNRQPGNVMPFPVRGAA